MGVAAEAAKDEKQPVSPVTHGKFGIYGTGDRIKPRKDLLPTPEDRKMGQQIGLDRVTGITVLGRFQWSEELVGMCGPLPRRKIRWVKERKFTSKWVLVHARRVSPDRSGRAPNRDGRTGNDRRNAGTGHVEVGLLNGSDVSPSERGQSFMSRYGSHKFSIDEIPQ